MAAWRPRPRCMRAAHSAYSSVDPSAGRSPVLARSSPCASLFDITSPPIHPYLPGSVGMCAVKSTGTASRHDPVTGFVGFARQFHAALGNECAQQVVHQAHQRRITADLERSVLLDGRDAMFLHVARDD